MDRLETMNVSKDTSYALMRAAHQQGWEVYHLLLSELSLHDDKLLAKGRRLTAFPQGVVPTAEPVAGLTLNNIDSLWIRKDPPFDRRYFYSTLLLDFLPEPVFIVNSPASLRDFNEKLAAVSFLDHAPETLISCDTTEIKEFVAKFERAVIKPIDGFGGKGISFVTAEDADVEQKIEALTHSGRRWIVANPFVKDADLGDKRILLVEGEPIGAILRKSETGGLQHLFGRPSYFAIQTVSGNLIYRVEFVICFNHIILLIPLHAVLGTK